MGEALARPPATLCKTELWKDLQKQPWSNVFDRARLLNLEVAIPQVVACLLSYSALPWPSITSVVVVKATLKAEEATVQAEEKANLCSSC